VPRVCFTLQVRPERLTERRERHAAVWPEMLDALSEAGWGNYPLFLRGDVAAAGDLPSPGSARRAPGKPTPHTMTWIVAGHGPTRTGRTR
jgi:hypothetical protein